MASRRPLVRASGGNRQLPSGDTLDASVTGNAATANKLATARTLSWTGDVTGSTTYDGSANSSAALTLAASGVAAGTYGGVTVNAKGIVTGGTPISPATQTALDAKANSASPTFTGTGTFTGNSTVFNPSSASTIGVEFGYTGGAATTPFWDWHSGATAVDYDYRMIASGGSGSAGGGSMTFRGSLSAFDHQVNITTSGLVKGLLIQDTGPNGAGIQLAGNGSANTSKFIRASGGNFQIVNSAYSSVIFTVTDAGAVNTAGALSVAGQTTFSLPNKVAQYTLATLPSASAYSGFEIDVTDATGGAKRCRSNGANWIILNTTTTVS